MTTQSWLLLAVYLVVLLAATKPLGLYMVKLMEAPCWQPLARLENGVFRVCGIGREEMSWRQYALAVLVFSLVGFIVVYALQRLQLWLPFNPQQIPNVTPDSSFNTAISFVTNTNWQGYGGEASMSYLSQMLGLGVQNFVSAAAGIAVLFALIRGFARHSAQTIGNFWADLYRVTAYLLLPLSFVLALVLVSQGVVQNFSAYQEVTTLEPTTYEATKLDAAGHSSQRKPDRDQANPAHGACRLADRDQAARHKRRRLL
jgi:K+-transporting ATPase ATPase A chain